MALLGLWKIHLQAARTMIRRWSIAANLPTSLDPTRSFLVQELFATNVMASVTNFKPNDELVSVTLQSNDRAPFIGFLHVIQSVTKIERDGLGPHRSLAKVEDLEGGLGKVRKHALNCSRSLTFRSNDIRHEFDDVVDIFYHSGLMYLYRCLLSQQDADIMITDSKKKLLTRLRDLKDVIPFAQDLPWPLFIAGTECAGIIEEQGCVEWRMLEMVRLCGTLDQLKALGFLKRFWKMAFPSPHVSCVDVDYPPLHRPYYSIYNDTARA
jgi:hypothetical protein